MIGEVFFSIGSVHIYTYGFFVMLAVILASFIILVLCQKNNLTKGVIFDLIIYTLIFGIVGARITYYVLYSDQFESFWEIFKIWQGGLVSWGGFVTGFIAAIAVLKIYGEKILPWLDVLTIAGLSALAVGRLGSFLSGELAGLEYHGLFSVKGVYPITLYESLFLFVLFFVWLVVYLIYYKKIRSGFFTLGAIASYSFGRFLVDFLRQEDKIFLKLSLGQIFSLSVFILSLVLLILFFRSNRKGPENVITTND